MIKRWWFQSLVLYGFCGSCEWIEAWTCPWQTSSSKPPFQSSWRWLCSRLRDRSCRPIRRIWWPKAWAAWIPAMARKPWSWSCGLVTYLGSTRRENWSSRCSNESKVSWMDLIPCCEKCPAWNFDCYSGHCQMADGSPTKSTAEVCNGAPVQEMGQVGGFPAGY